MMKITHIITGLNVGGAEMMLYKLLAYSDRTAYPAEVISLTDIGPIGKKIQKLNVPVYEVGLHQGIAGIIGFVRLVGLLQKQKPDIVQTWMYHADLIGGLAAKLGFLNAPVVWGVRQSNLHPQLSKRRTIWIARISAFLSHWIPTKIVCVSESARRTHAEMGYDKTKMVVIPNGFDIARFRPDSRARTSVREELGIPLDSLLVGYVARFDAQKDHQTFIRAAQSLHLSFPKVHFVLCGQGINWENKQLAELIEPAGLSDRFHLLGERDDIPRITAAFDVASLTAAYGEGFPNVLGEAMACAIPCVATDVGDSASIIANTGFVVPTRDSQALAQAWKQMIEKGKEGRGELGKKARMRVERYYAIPKIVEQYMLLYNKSV